MRKLLPLPALALIAGLCWPAAPARAQETISIDPSAPQKPFPHFWEQMFGSGRAVLSLREDYRNDLRTVKKATGFEYVRFHGIFDHEMGVYDEDSHGNPVYNFSYVDQVYDGLLANGVKPFVELSFMPEKLAANPKPHPFWYKPLPSPPKDPRRWAALVTAFLNHLIARYGKQEVESWYFEVWNEPNIDFWDGVPKEQTYYAFYDVTARAIKAVDTRLRVGGPATAQAAWVDRFIAHCTQNRVPFDFVSTHIYGNEKSEDVFGKQIDISQRDMVGRAARKVYDQVKSSAAPNVPIVWSEYNATYLNRPDNTDSAFMGPWLANNIRECDGLTGMMSYWTFSDVFEEQGIVKTPFYGGFGLIAERSIPKAAFNAFVLLHRLGDHRLANDSDSVLVTRRNDGTLVVALWNYAPAGEDGKSRTFRLALKGNAEARYRIQFVDANHGSSLTEWQAIGSPAFPMREQIRKLVTASKMAPPMEHPLADPISLASHALAVIEIR
jgi:xylan 1,4-beta-xylosidase